jgi:hypothetical protein
MSSKRDSAVRLVDVVELCRMAISHPTSGAPAALGRFREMRAQGIEPTIEHSRYNGYRVRDPHAIPHWILFPD